MGRLGKVTNFLVLVLTVSACSTTPPQTEVSMIKMPSASIEDQFHTDPGVTVAIISSEQIKANSVVDCIPTENCESRFDEVRDLSSDDVLPRVIAKEFIPVIYGAPQPLTCSTAIPPSEKLENRPNLQLMWENYIDDVPPVVWSVVGGAVEINGCLPEDEGQWRNACAVRLSHMLNNAGHKISKIYGKTVTGRSGENYFFRLSDIQIYLESKFGKADFVISKGEKTWFDIPPLPGLMIIRAHGEDFTGHATLWNGNGSIDDTQIEAYRVLFWELPCFIPSDRLSELKTAF